jgi:hypothetical protein
MREERIPTYECFLCRRPYKFGIHHYDGRPVPQLGMNICHSCERANWDGIVPDARILAHLNEKGITVRLNKNGWIDIPPVGSR